MKYDPKKIEKKWQNKWIKDKTFVAPNKSKAKKKMVLVEFPYPSGAGLHMGHMRPFIAGDVTAKYFRLKGFNTMYPMGWDAFGLPAENYAIKNKVHPSISTKQNVANAKKQLLSWGTGFDWSREINTTDPEYYKWTQKLFLEFFKAGLAYEKFGEINWCPKDKTGLANEEVVDGKCERCGETVEKKNLRQWYLKITDYAEKLLDGLKELPEWPESVKLQQENWIGKSEGSEIEFRIKNQESRIKVFTTRADTLFGVTYVVLAPEHPLLQTLTIENKKEVEKYINDCKNKSDEERTNDKKEKTGVEIKGVKAINPANDEEVPVWVADYVLGNYGTGAVMAVPAHDERDFEFAKKFGLPIKSVVLPKGVDYPIYQKTKELIDGKTKVTEIIDQSIFDYLDGAKPFLGEGYLVDSGNFNRFSSEEARKKITEFVGGKIVTKYKLRDWVFSRQRYWGEPIPLVHCPKCGIVPVPEKDLPVKLPNVKNYEPTGTGESPLAGIENWVKTPCPKCVEDQKKTKYLVFDFDGVIADTYKANLVAHFKAGWSTSIEDSKRTVFEYFSRHPNHSRDKKMSPEEKKKMFFQCSIACEAVKDHTFKLFDSFVKEVKKIKNCKIAIVSTGMNIYVKDGVKRSGLKPDIVLTLEDSFSKEDKLETVAKKWKVDIKDLFYFTDATCDVYELENLMDRKKIIGCLWGYLGYDELKKALPEEQILKKPTDIHNLFKPCVARRETNTMPQWAGSSWYWLRYMDPKNTKEFSSLASQKYWSPVDLYFGGMEHTTLHLLYSRFWNLVFKDRGIVAVSEPYKKRVPHGIILGPDGEKMSKSRGNVVNPDDVIALYGADTVRLYMMFLGPHGAQVSWNDKGIVGTRRFLERVYAMKEMIIKKDDEEVEKSLHKTIKKVSEDIETFSFNTAVSAMMIFANTVYGKKGISKASLLTFVQLLSPFAPHMSEEMWTNLQGKKSVFQTVWPTFDPKKLVDTKVTIVVQINGKLRGSLVFDAGVEEADVLNSVKKDDKLAPLLEAEVVKKVIFIKDKLINIVI